MTMEHKRHIKLDGDDSRIERIHRAMEFVPLSLYDEITKLGEDAVGELIREHNGLLEQFETQKSMAKGYRLRLEALLAVCEEYLLWEPRKRGHADRHRIFSEYVRGERALVGDDSQESSYLYERIDFAPTEYMHPDTGVLADSSPAISPKEGE